jgi:putative glutamine amidotransferase
LAETPLIGVCTAVEQVRHGAWDRESMLLHRTYVEAIQRAGGVALMLPPDPAVTADPDRVLDVLDGLILAGGRDVDPGTYGAEPHPETDPPVTARDEFEIALARRAMERDLPLLGICRGMQVMNVARGGTLVQHLPEHVGHEDHRRSLGTFDGNDHPVHLAGGSLAARAAGEVSHGTLSHHHQGIDRVGDGFEVTGWSDDDEVPEALEDPGLGFALGVQWHPEADEQSRVIAALVEDARRRMRER